MMFPVEEDGGGRVTLLRNAFAWLKENVLRNRQIFTIGSILFLGILGFSFLVFFQSRAPKAKVAKIATPVTVTSVRPESVTSRVRGYGTISSRRGLDVRPEVTGTVVRLSPHMEVGGRVQEGEVIFSLDKRDYELAVTDAEAALERARFELKLEEGNQIIAKREWGLLREDGSDSEDISPELTLRKPHLAEKRAQLQAAEAGLERAKLNLSRTEFKAPFESVVVSEQLEVGRYVSPQEQVASLAAVDVFQIEAEIPKSDLIFLEALMDGERGEELPALIQQRMRDGMIFQRTGRAVRLLSNLSDEGRMARVLVFVEDPLRADRERGQLPLLLGSYVEVIIEGRELHGVYAIPNRAIREGGVIWTVTPEGTLQTLPVIQELSSPETVYVSLPEEATALLGKRDGPLGDSDGKRELTVITNSLSTVLDGMPVRIQQGEADVR